MLNKIETMVNERIRDNVEVSMEEMEAEKAFQSGATALFEEKYGDKVRVVSLSDFSKEFCGGTHIKRTGEIGFFKIISESSVAAGIRRIEALTGEAAVSHVQRFLSILQETASMIKEKPESVAAKIEKILSDQKRLEKEVEKLKSAIAAKSADIASDEIKEINGIKVLVKKVSVEKPAMLRELADRFKDRVKSGIVVLGAISGSKVLLIAAVTSDLTGKYHAGEIIKIIALEVGGNGGGRADMAQAGGTQPENLDRALEKVYEILRIAS
jgi:alanyl-tRNA synthetase